MNYVISVTYFYQNVISAIIILKTTISVIVILKIKFVKHYLNHLHVTKFLLKLSKLLLAKKSREKKNKKGNKRKKRSPYSTLN